MHIKSHAKIICQFNKQRYTPKCEKVHSLISFFLFPEEHYQPKNITKQSKHQSHLKHKSKAFFNKVI